MIHSDFRSCVSKPAEILVLPVFSSAIGRGALCPGVVLTLRVGGAGESGSPKITNISAPDIVEPKPMAFHPKGP